MLENESLSRKFVKKGFWLYAFTFFIGPLGYVVKMILSGDLSVSEVGLIYGVISLATLVGTYNDLGFTESLNYFLPKYILEKEYGKGKYIIALALFAQGVTSLFIASLLWIWGPWIAIAHFKSELAASLLFITGFFFIGINILQLTTAIFSVVQDTKLQKGMELIRIGLVALGSLILLLSEQGTMTNYMWIWLFGVIITAIISSYLCYTKYYLPYFKNVQAYLPKVEKKHFIRYALATLFTTNIAIMISQVDMQLLFYFLPGNIASEQAGYYGNYLSLMSIPFIFISPIVHFLFPVVSELSSRNDKEKIQTIHARFTLYFSIIALWTSVFFFEFGEKLSVLLFTEKFAISGTILKYSAFFLIFNFLSQINFQILSGTGKVGIRAKIFLVILPINIILNILFIRWFSVLPGQLAVYGSALAVGLSWIPLWYMTHHATREYHSKWSLRDIFRNILLIALTFCLFYFSEPLWKNLNNFIVLSIAILGNMIIFLLGNRAMIAEVFSTIKNNRHS